MTNRIRCRARTCSALAAAAAALLLLPAAAEAGGSETLRTLRVDLSAGDAGTLEIEVPVGEVRVDGTDGSRVEATVEVQCNRPVKSRCEAMAQRVELASGSAGERAWIKLDGWPSGKDSSGLSVRVELSMPRQLGLVADLGVGEFEAVGLVSDLALDLGVGEATIRAREEHVRRVDLEVGVGEAVLRVGERTIEGKGFIGRDLAWSHGHGAAALKVDCGVGEVDVRLEDEE
jgi:hypothetical protein